MSKRKYNTEYIKYGFLSVQHRGDCFSQCVICMKTLCNSAMKPRLLKRHLESNHSAKKDRDKSYFQRLSENVERVFEPEWPELPKECWNSSCFLCSIFTNCQKYESSHYCRKSCSTSSKNTGSENNWRKGG